MSTQDHGLPLMGGRNTAPLTEHQIGRAALQFGGLDSTVQTVRFDSASSTVFRVVDAADSITGEEYGEIVYGPDIYPGTGLANPNSALSMPAAAAHELAHYHRWFDLRELHGEHLRHLDEAMTSMEAIQRYGHKLCDTDVQQLVGDALHRMSLYAASLRTNDVDEAR